MAMNLLLAGASGKMGKAIIDICAADSRQGKIVATLNSKGFEEHSSPNMAIDFSLVEARDMVLAMCLEKGIPLVSGVTGYSEKDLKELKKASKKIPIFWSPNMSTGIAVMNSLIRSLSVIKKDFDFQIEEFHHIHKKDSPSGTAIFLQKTLEETVGKTPQPVSIRGGGIYGVHSVFAMSEEEVIEIKHTALKREVFAKGALRVAGWLKSKKSGFYSMEDFIGF